MVIIFILLGITDDTVNMLLIWVASFVLSAWYTEREKARFKRQHLEDGGNLFMKMPVNK